MQMANMWLVSEALLAHALDKPQLLSYRLWRLSHILCSLNLWLSLTHAVLLQLVVNSMSNLLWWSQNAPASIVHVPSYASNGITNNVAATPTIISSNVVAQASLKLTATNYLAWLLQFITLLTRYDLLGFIDRTCSCPKPTTLILVSQVSTQRIILDCVKTNWFLTQLLVLYHLLWSLSLLCSYILRSLDDIGIYVWETNSRPHHPTEGTIK